MVVFFQKVVEKPSGKFLLLLLEGRQTVVEKVAKVNFQVGFWGFYYFFFSTPNNSNPLMEEYLVSTEYFCPRWTYLPTT